MHKKSMIIIAMVAVMLVSIVPVFAAKPTSPAASNGLDKGKNDHLYLYEKDSDTWEIVEDAAWGKLNINVKKGQFVLNAHKLEPETDYVLICYQDSWPGTGSLLLGNGTSNEEGNVHIKGSVDYETLPSYVYDIDGTQVEGSKIWLVLAADFDKEAPEMDAWNPSEYLFEFDLLNKQEVVPE
ncbi:MAG: hypothetical protein E3J73_01250 [Candidatus Bathyarchaeum sp.]|nr:MAG: hypothetical protein E3J73_01250 [Candidatus Bathyarchaeum sp.]